MSKTATVRARIEPQLKEKVETIFQELGLTTTEAINLFYKQVELQQGLPFEVKIPNRITQKTFKEKVSTIVKSLAKQGFNACINTFVPGKFRYNYAENVELT